MKKAISVILFVLTILVVLVMIGGVIFGAVDLSREYNALIASPGHSGADFLGVVLGASAVAFFAFIGSVVALILSLINVKIAENRFIQTFSLIMVMLMGMVSFFSLFCAIGGVGL